MITEFPHNFFFFNSTFTIWIVSGLFSIIFTHRIISQSLLLLYVLPAHSKAHHQFNIKRNIKKERVENFIELPSTALNKLHLSQIPASKQDLWHITTTSIHVMGAISPVATAMSHFSFRITVVSGTHFNVDICFLQGAQSRQPCFIFRMDVYAGLVSLEIYFESNHHKVETKKR